MSGLSIALQSNEKWYTFSLKGTSLESMIFPRNVT